MSTPDALRCFILGSESLVIPCAETLLADGHRVLGIVTADPGIVHWAQSVGIPCLAPTSSYRDVLAAQPFEYLFSITNLTILPGDVLALPTRGAINFHDGPLPSYGGLHAPAWALMDQQAEHGITWHLMSEDADTGDVLLQRMVTIAPDETSFTLNLKCFEAAIDSFGDLIRGLVAGTIQPRPHALDRSTYHGRADRPTGRGVLRWSDRMSNLGALARALDFGGHPNPLVLPKLLLPDGTVALVAALEPTLAPAATEPGTVLAADAEQLLVAVRDGALRLTRLLSIDGEPLSLADMQAEHGIRAGVRLPEPSEELIGRVDSATERLAPHEAYWVRRLVALDPLALPVPMTYGDDAPATAPAPVVVALPAMHDALPAARRADIAVATVAAWLGRLTGRWRFDVAWRDAAVREAAGGVQRWFSTVVPLRVDLTPESGLRAATESLAATLAGMRTRGTYARSIFARYPALRDVPRNGLGLALTVGIVVGDEAPASHALTLLIAPDGTSCTLRAEPGSLVAGDLARLAAQLETFAAAAASVPEAALASLPLMPRELARRIAEWNATAREVPAACMHELILAQAARTPDALALAHGPDELTYAALVARATRLARHLRVLGVGPDLPVGLCMHRSPELVIGALAIQMAGGAYLPLDPSYPADRLAFMLADSEAPLLLTQERLLDALPGGGRASVVCIERVEAAEAVDDEATAEPLAPLARPDNLAYVIYTSGSTGLPKGVMLEHRTVANFFAGMDERIGPQPGVWLAVTSLSFDISVLELFWTLARGFSVVVAGDEARAGEQRPMQFSLFYFSADERESRTDKYRLLIEGAKFADTHGFVAVWTPERHFHAFGGLYPNPALTSAALATITSRVELRAGSSVVPLHHPLRLAEEWSMVDNLSNGRVAISIAAGWQPNDFVLRPESFGRAKDAMWSSIDIVQRLWRGEAVAFPSPLGNGKEVEVRVLPRPVQATLPLWLTTAGTADSYRLAGEKGVKVLTHLLGQTVEELGEKIALYREAWRAAGHPGAGHVSLMLHTFVGDDDAAVKELVREPMIAYLRTSLNLVKQHAWSFPAFKKRADGSAAGMDVDLDKLDAGEMEALLEYSFERYYETSALFGTPERCLEIADGLRDIGVDELACLIDFGVDSEVVLAHLERLDAVRQAAQAPRAARMAGEDWSHAALLARHRVTHLQCTPSLAVMLMADERARQQMRHLKVMMVGGEALPTPLAEQLRGVVGGRVLNMYGPTETTIWSTVHAIGREERAVPIGTPIANTQCYIVDALLRPVAPGMPGELLIGGDGVARGYLRRPELTAERFIQLEWAPAPWQRVYRTGDLARWREDGVLEFLGRIDHQVKIRGFRIELGEIETRLQRHALVREAVVVAREDEPGDKRLVAYVVLHEGAPAAAPDTLRDTLREALPEHMVPGHVVVLAALPRTPNLKIDRKALPAPADHLAAARLVENVAAPDAPATRVAAPGVKPAAALPMLAATTAALSPAASATSAAALEGEIAGMWRELLKVPSIGLRDNFFDLGGHSLLAVQVHGRLRKLTGRDFPITALFRYPTVSALAAFLAAGPETTREAPVAAGAPASNRGAARRAALLGRARGT